MVNPLANHVPVVNIKLKVAQHRVIHVPVGNTTTKRNAQQKLIAKHVPVVLTALVVRQVVHISQLLVLLEPMPTV